MELKLAEKIFIYLWTFWAGIVFFVILTLCIPIIVVPVLLHQEKLKVKAWKLVRYAAKLILVLWGIKLEVKNKHLMDAKGQYIFVPNHRSYLDAVTVGSSIPNHIKYLGKAEILSWPILGFILKHYNIPVQRNNAGSRHLSLEQMNELVKSGASLGIFPEGTCNTTKKLLKEFHEGAFKIAVPNKIPIVPITVIGTGELMPRNGILLKPGKVILYWHKPIETSTLQEKDIPQLSLQVQQILIDDLKQYYPNGYA